MTQTQNLMELNDKQYQLLKREYIDAINQKKDKFDLQGQPVLTKFAKYWLNSIENARKKRGLRIYNPKLHDKTHKCPDGQTYHWVSRKDESLACPRCKNRLDKPIKVEETK